MAHVQRWGISDGWCPIRWIQRCVHRPVHMPNGTIRDHRHWDWWQSIPFRHGHQRCTYRLPQLRGKRGFLPDEGRMDAKPKAHRVFLPVPLSPRWGMLLPKLSRYGLATYSPKSQSVFLLPVWSVDTGLWLLQETAEWLPLQPSKQSVSLFLM